MRMTLEHLADGRRVEVPYRIKWVQVTGAARFLVSFAFAAEAIAATPRFSGQRHSVTEPPCADTSRYAAGSEVEIDPDDLWFDGEQYEDIILSDEPARPEAA